jgi:hypothetical protein
VNTLARAMASKSRNNPPSTIAGVMTLNLATRDAP